MDRYTQHDSFGHFAPLASAEYGEWTLAGKFEKRLYGDATSRLAAYEDTGLTPEEVIALRDAKDTNVPTNADRIGGTDYFTLTSLLYDAIHSERVTTETCTGCRWRGRHQKCSCCRRNRSMKDLYAALPERSEG